MCFAKASSNLISKITKKPPTVRGSGRLGNRYAEKLSRFSIIIIQNITLKVNILQ